MTRNNPGISKGVDWSLIWLYLLLVSVGIMAIFAATYNEERDTSIISSFFSFKTDYSKQFFYFAIAGFIGIFILLTDSKFFTATANLWYAVGIVLMLLVFPFHSNVKGTESIIRLLVYGHPHLQSRHSPVSRGADDARTLDFSVPYPHGSISGDETELETSHRGLLGCRG